LFFGPCIFIIEGKTDQRNAQINFSLINLYYSNYSDTSQHSIVSTPPHVYSTQQHPSILTDYYNGL